MVYCPSNSGIILNNNFFGGKMQDLIERLNICKEKSASLQEHLDLANKTEQLEKLKKLSFETNFGTILIKHRQR
jgi:hypothetical protein